MLKTIAPMILRKWENAEDGIEFGQMRIKDGETKMADKPLSEIYLGDGESGGFWSISFNDLQLRHADVETDDMRTICVHVDEATGEISQSEGYAPGSRENRDETSLFAEFEDAIVQAMVDDHRFKDHAAFLERAAANQGDRKQALDDLNVTLAHLEIDLEDDDRERDGDD